MPTVSGFPSVAFPEKVWYAARGRAVFSDLAKFDAAATWNK